MSDTKKPVWVDNPEFYTTEALQWYLRERFARDNPNTYSGDDWANIFLLLVARCVSLDAMTQEAFSKLTALESSLAEVRAMVFRITGDIDEPEPAKDEGEFVSIDPSTPGGDMAATTRGRIKGGKMIIDKVTYDEPTKQDDAGAEEWAQKCLIWEDGHPEIWNGKGGPVPGNHAQVMVAQEHMPKARKRLAELLTAFSAAQTAKLRDELKQQSIDAADQRKVQEDTLAGTRNEYEKMRLRAEKAESERDSLREKVGRIRQLLNIWRGPSTMEDAILAVNKAMKEVGL